jgi:hypothetical protein
MTRAQRSTPAEAGPSLGARQVCQTRDEMVNPHAWGTLAAWASLAEQSCGRRENGRPSSGRLDPLGNLTQAGGDAPNSAHRPRTLDSPTEGGESRLIGAWVPARGGVWLAALTLAAPGSGSLTVPAQVQQVQGQPVPSISATFTYRQSDDGCGNVTFTWDGGTWGAGVRASSSGAPPTCTAAMIARPPANGVGAGQHQVCASSSANFAVSDCKTLTVAIVAPAIAATPTPARPAPTATPSPAIGAVAGSPDAVPSPSSAPAKASGGRRSDAGSAVAATSLFVFMVLVAVGGSAVAMRSLIRAARQ